MRACGKCRYFLKYYSNKDEQLTYEGVGRCTNERSPRCDYIEADFRKCEKFSAIKSK